MHRVLLLLTVLISFLAAEQGRADDPKALLTGALEKLRQVESPLASRCAAVGIPIPAELTEAVSKLRTAAQAWMEQIAAGTADQGGLDDFLHRLSQWQNALSGVDQLAQQLASEAHSFPHAQDAPEAKALRELGIKRAAGKFAAALAGRDIWDRQAQADQERDQVLHAALALVEAERGVAERFPKLPVDQAPMSEYVAFCRAAQVRIAKLLADRGGDHPGQTSYWTQQAIQRWDELLFCEVERRDLEQAQAKADPARAAALAAATALQTALRAAAAWMVAPAADDEQRNRERQQWDTKIEALRESWRTSQELARSGGEVTEQRKRIDGSLAKCGDRVRKALADRAAQIQAEIAKAGAAALAAHAAGDRVAALESKGELGAATIRLEHLADEVDEEAELAESERAWAGHEQDAALAEPLKDYRQARDRVAKARAKRLAGALKDQQLQSRLELLQLKQELMQEQQNELENALNKAQEEVRSAAERLSERMQGGDPQARERNAKDAERIPLVAPGDNNF